MSNDGVTVDVPTDEGNEPVCLFKATEVIRKGTLGLVGTAKQGVTFQPVLTSTCILTLRGVTF
jgi:hypothetical protein